MKSEIQVQRRPSRTNDSATSRSSSPASTIVVKKEDDQSLSLSPFPPSPSSNPSTPLTTWPYSALLTSQSLISPSQLIVKRSSSPDQLSLTTFPAKKIKRKARTEEEKEVRAYERTMRNRRAAQESRDRKKRQFEALEEENKRLHVENKKMKQRIKQLEQQHPPYNLALDVPLSPLPQSSKCETLDSDLESESCASTSPATSFIVVKQEDPESLDLEESLSTFHPAVVNDLQCLTNSLTKFLYRLRCVMTSYHPHMICLRQMSCSIRF
jgi:bZIP transcription factor